MSYKGNKNGQNHAKHIANIDIVPHIFIQSYDNSSWAMPRTRKYIKRVRLFKSILYLGIIETVSMYHKRFNFISITPDQ